MTIQDVARHLGVSWDLIKEIQKQHLLRRFARPKLHKLKQIAIDEISIGKEHRLADEEHRHHCHGLSVDRLLMSKFCGFGPKNLIK